MVIWSRFSFIWTRCFFSILCWNFNEIEHKEPRCVLRWKSALWARERREAFNNKVSYSEHTVIFIHIHEAFLVSFFCFKFNSQKWSEIAFVQYWIWNPFTSISNNNIMSQIQKSCILRLLADSCHRYTHLLYGKSPSPYSF